MFKKFLTTLAGVGLGLAKNVVGGPITTIAAIALPVLQIAQTTAIRPPQNSAEWTNAIATAVTTALLLAAEDPRLGAKAPGPEKGDQRKDGQ